MGYGERWANLKPFVVILCKANEFHYLFPYTKAHVHLTTLNTSERKELDVLKFDNQSIRLLMYTHARWGLRPGFCSQV